MEFSINSRKHGPIIFFTDGDPGDHIFVNLNGKEGYLGNQICRGGDLMGPTLHLPYKMEEGTEEKIFEKMCRSWWRQFLKERQT